MSLQHFNEQYLPLINFIVSLTGLVSLILLILQYKKDNRWMKLQSSYNFIGIGEEMALQERLYTIYERLNVYSFPEEKSQQLTPEQVDRIASNLEATLVTNMFLNHFQNLCTAYRFGLVDEKVFRNIHHSRICWWYNILAPYIERRKIDYHNSTIWSQFVELAQQPRV
ncbi:MAG TPA: DUF4760 domain-containing protein [Ferruginibacter sp.]|nr:DUF4760 domain-containing protein [Ferruginibacter sp.]HRO06657.1 DUF4760 domain-containing protein [Ferruginibacter sp.]HRO96344.1 DUF4760 domain-containing protein [Ferruginibacter sp.]HRP48449.1 DUF4760 domain-containing protein [Ferruginibacter sp.]